ncbi:MAG: HepT-like ribonuclease domain-containing protein [Fimbriimonadaceae bacterium]
MPLRIGGPQASNGNERRGHGRRVSRAAQRALLHMDGLTKAEFESDDKTVDAVLRCLTFVGEAAKRRPESAPSAYPQVPWRGITGFRDRVVHDYLGTDLTIVWELL